VDDTKKVMAEVGAKLEQLGLSESEGAKAIGVTPTSLSRHLDGAYVRSDSLAKYRRWLAGKTSTSGAEAITPPETLTRRAPRAAPVDSLDGPQAKPTEPLRVVDLFGGCGGLSLGFELANGGGLYRTVLAIDIEEAMVRVFNANHPHRNAECPVGRQADLAEFINEAEVLAYYLDHLANSERDQHLGRELDSVSPVGLGAFVRTILAIDAAFVEKLTQIRAGRQFLDAYAAVDNSALSQTSVLGFHNALKLPQPGTGRPTFSPPLWGRNGRVDVSGASSVPRIADAIRSECELGAKALWKQEITKLRERGIGLGSGQLASAARKIKQSLTLIDGDAYKPIQAAWITWRTARDATRRTLFEDEGVLNQLRRIYRDGREVHVLLGGPPCQGFSRIGRGKIRSLREQSVHVQSDAKAGDKRNELMLQYVLFVAALAPATFLFENVRHFQAEVKTPDGTFNATDILAEAISDISHDGLEYGIASRIVVASDHLVPQTRERFFMVGLRHDLGGLADRSDAASWCLTLPPRSPVPLKSALAGLPEPVYASASAERAGSTDTVLEVEDLHVHGNGPVGEFMEWIRQPPPADRRTHDHRRIDAHCTRDSRPDDRAFFEMLGPGKRWMDYRCDGNPLVEDLARLVEWAIDHQAGGVAGLDRDRLTHLLGALDGSLSLRLLLDRIPLGPGEQEHHLCAPNYLKKREGSHGDWLARLDAEAPAKTMVSHMGKDTYAYIHPSAPRTISVREAARVQTFPDWYSFGSVGLVDGYRVIGNAVPPLLSAQLALRVGVILERGGLIRQEDRDPSRPAARSAPPATAAQPSLV
jgi:site-specific DNA-cytosine methylase